MEFKPVLEKRHEIESDVNTSNSKQLRQQYAYCCQVGGYIITIELSCMDLRKQLKKLWSNTMIA